MPKVGAQGFKSCGCEGKVMEVEERSWCEEGGEYVA